MNQNGNCDSANAEKKKRVSKLHDIIFWGAKIEICGVMDKIQANFCMFCIFLLYVSNKNIVLI